MANFFNSFNEVEIGAKLPRMTLWPRFAVGLETTRLFKKIWLLVDIMRKVSNYMKIEIKLI